ncbi:hypothetical protein BDV98DRAFT_57020 [Pterulicium gracile]|uniref:Uncharacterized protein n=1 Tax=Pterulicium gracile TaxID=1884261 RepID=A0A5C3QM51_9AGAR|nr:hypothetical protein BDV98DRAFT_57020 [Pterula gracilis]
MTGKSTIDTEQIATLNLKRPHSPTACDKDGAEELLRVSLDKMTVCPLSRTFNTIYLFRQAPPCRSAPPLIIICKVFLASSALTICLVRTRNGATLR